MLTTIRLDVERLAAGALEALLDRMCAETKERDIEDWYAGSNDKAGNTVWPGGIPDGTTGSSLSGTGRYAGLRRWAGMILLIGWFARHGAGGVGQTQRTG